MLYNFFKNIFRLLFNTIFLWDIKGRNNIPKDGPLIICANHIHWLDPPLVGAMVPRKNVHFMAKEELFNYKILGSIIRNIGAFPVKRDSADLKTIKKALSLLNNKSFIGLFPEGTRSKTGEIGEALPGVALIALKSRSPVLPVAIKGDYKIFKKVKINIGKPIFFESHYGKKAKRELLDVISTDIMKEIKALHSEL